MEMTRKQIIGSVIAACVAIAAGARAQGFGKDAVLVEGGSFTMGSNAFPTREKPANAVKVSSFSRDWTWRNPRFPQTDDHPVVAVSWLDAVRYANWRSSADGLEPADTAYTYTGIRLARNP